MNREDLLKYKQAELPKEIKDFMGEVDDKEIEIARTARLFGMEDDWQYIWSDTNGSLMFRNIHSGKRRVIAVFDVKEN